MSSNIIFRSILFPKNIFQMAFEKIIKNLRSSNSYGKQFFRRILFIKYGDRKISSNIKCFHFKRICDSNSPRTKNFEAKVMTKFNYSRNLDF